jgi:predicted nucleic acid-binding Zn finger protein
MIAVMFLKHHLGLSDEKLIEQINHNVSLQLFCKMRLGNLELIRDTGIISRIRGYLGEHLDLAQFQASMIEPWKDCIEHPHFVKMDAVCFESYIRYPTDVKLLWECCQWVYQKELFQLRKLLKIPLGKENDRFKEQHKKYLIYAKLKRKTYKKSRKRTKSLLNLLKRGLTALQSLLNSFFKGSLEVGFYRHLKTIKTVVKQQTYLYQHNSKKIKNRIVSIYKPYIRPIKRGKENKPTEFGAKVHMLQTGGVCLIEHLSFSAFNECKRLQSSTTTHQLLFGACHQISADKIYATNENRRFCTKNKIFTGFVAKGRPPKKEIKQLKAALNKERSTRLEGAFGNHKNHYGLAKVKARKESTEVIWIFFGVWTANTVYITKKRQAFQTQKEKNNHHSLKIAA